MRRKYGEKVLIIAVMVFGVTCIEARAQRNVEPRSDLPVRYEELTAPEFVQAVGKSDSVCIIPIGILEKHGPQLPLGTDLLNMREVVYRATKKEYCVVFPQYYFGQINEAKHQPGTVAYSPELVWKMLQETCDELARNGFKKIIIANGHGGNRAFLQYFCQAQLWTPRSYSVVLFTPENDTVVENRLKELKRTTNDGHAGETETSEVLAHRPDLAHVERGKDQSGENLNRLAHLPYVSTGIWWFARYPNHYAGDGSVADPRIGELVLNSDAEQLAKLVRAIKQDTAIEKLQQEFYRKSEKPLDTKQ